MRLLRSPIVRRLLISFVIGLVLAWGMSEVSFALLRDSSDHVPQRVELDIPAGTADRVAAGEAVPSLPPEMVFVVGDVLVVRNDDLVSHQLGPVWVPPGSSASLALERGAAVLAITASNIDGPEETYSPGTSVWGSRIFGSLSLEL